MDCDCLTSDLFPAVLAAWQSTTALLLTYMTAMQFMQQEWPQWRCAPFICQHIHSAVPRPRYQQTQWLLFDLVWSSISAYLPCHQWKCWPGEVALHSAFFLELAAPQDWDLSVFDLCSSITYLLMQVLLMPQVLPNHVVVHRTVALVALYHRCYPGPLNSTRYSWLLPLYNPFCLSLHKSTFAER